MARRESKYRITAEDKTKKATQSAQKNAGRMEGSFTKLGGAATKLGGVMAAAFSVKLIKDFTQESLRAWGQQERAMNKLTLAVENSPLLTGDAAGSLATFAAEMQKTTTIGDETTMAMQSMLASMDLTTEQINKTVKAAANYSAAMGVDMTQAVRQLSKSYSGLQGELGEQIPAIRELTKEQLENGEAIDLINEKYAGMAEQLRGDTLGGVKAFTNAWGDMTEQVGRSVSRTFDPLIKTLTGIAEALGGILEKANDNKDAWTEYGEAYERFLSKQSVTSDMSLKNMQAALSVAREELRQSREADIHGDGNQQLAEFVNLLETQISKQQRVNALHKDLAQQAQAGQEALTQSATENAEKVASVYESAFGEWLGKWAAKADPVAAKIAELQDNLYRAQANLSVAMEEGSNYTDQEISKLKVVRNYLQDQLKMLREKNRITSRPHTRAPDSAYGPELQDVPRTAPDSGFGAIAGQLQGAVGALGMMSSEISGLSALLNPMNTVLKSMAETLAPVLTSVEVLAGMLSHLGTVAGTMLIPIMEVWNGLVMKMAEIWLWGYNNVFRHIANGFISVFNTIYNAWAAFVNGILWMVDQIPFVNVGRVKYKPLDENHLDKISINDLASAGGATESGGTTGTGASYSAPRDITVNVDITTEAIAGPGGLRDLALMIRGEIEAAAALGV